MSWISRTQSGISLIGFDLPHGSASAASRASVSESGIVKTSGILSSTGCRCWSQTLELLSFCLKLKRQKRVTILKWHYLETWEAEAKHDTDGNLFFLPWLSNKFRLRLQTLNRSCRRCPSQNHSGLAAAACCSSGSRSCDLNRLEKSSPNASRGDTSAAATSSPCVTAIPRYSPVVCLQVLTLRPS